MHGPMYIYTRCVSESGDFATPFFLVRQHWGGCRYRHFAAKFKAFYLQWSRGLEHCIKTVRIPDNIAVVTEAIERSPHRSARRHSVTRAV